MKIIADLHIHSKYSRATSTSLDIPNLEKYARIKGINLLGTGDFTHPIWIKEIKQQLKEDDSGILKTKTGFPFIMQTEISLVYTQDNKGRRVHLVVLAPNIETAEQITEYLKKHGRVDYDGRPIFKIPCDEFVYELNKINNKIEVIPAHAWTPWFGIFGSETGFDSMEECFKEQTKHIHSFETGLSSDPEMNWTLSSLDKYSILSFSDCHSFWPWRLGREATIFELKELTYDNLIKAIRTKEGIARTIEVDPSYGKYHFDGHRNCNFSSSPEESKKINNICPVCKKGLTIGVLNRVEALADRKLGFKPKDAKPFHRLIPLSEIISALFQSSLSSKTVWQEYNNLVKDSRTELDILLNFKIDDLKKLTNEKIAEAIIKNRKGEIAVKPGYDGEYGIPILEPINEKAQKKKDSKEAKAQKSLEEF